MTDKAISPLRRRLIEDMTIRRLSANTQHQYIRHVKSFADFVGLPRRGWSCRVWPWTEPERHSGPSRSSGDCSCHHDLIHAPGAHTASPTVVAANHVPA
jgi:hypothetical protein